MALRKADVALFAEGGLVLHDFLHSLYSIGLVPSMSFNFSLTFSSLIEVNSDKDFAVLWRRSPS